MPDPAIQAAIERGTIVSELLIAFRDALFEPCAGILLIAGDDGLRASVAGAVEAVISASKKPHQPQGGVR